MQLAPFPLAVPYLLGPRRPEDRAAMEGGPDLAAPADDSATNAPAIQPPQSPAPVAGEPEAQAAARPAPGNRGEQLLAEAKALYTNGNYPAARQLANEAKAGKFGVDAQADELIAQIGMAEQGGALSLYEAALAALRKGDNAAGPRPADRGRRRRRLARRRGLRGQGRGPPPEALRPGPRPKPGAASTDRRGPGRRDARRPEAQRRGRHQDRRGPPLPRDRSRQGHRHLRADHAGRPGLRASRPS